MKEKTIPKRCLKKASYNDFIEVYENGVVLSRGKELKGEICKNGYKRVHVSKNGKSKRLLVHRIVATAFIPNPDNLPEVNHKDGNKQNNNVSNLEWVTASENQKHAYKTGLKSAKGIKNGARKLTETDVKEIRNHYVKGKHGEYNTNGLAVKYGVSPRTILQVIKQETWKEGEETGSRKTIRE